MDRYRVEHLTMLKTTDANWKAKGHKVHTLPHPPSDTTQKQPVIPQKTTDDEETRSDDGFDLVKLKQEADMTRRRREEEAIHLGEVWLQGEKLSKLEERLAYPLSRDGASATERQKDSTLQHGDSGIGYSSSSKGSVEQVRQLASLDMASDLAQRRQTRQSSVRQISSTAIPPFTSIKTAAAAPHDTTRSSSAGNATFSSSDLSGLETLREYLLRYWAEQGTQPDHAGTPDNKEANKARSAPRRPASPVRKDTPLDRSSSQSGTSVTPRTRKRKTQVSKDAQARDAEAGQDATSPLQAMITRKRRRSVHAPESPQTQRGSKPQSPDSASPRKRRRSVKPLSQRAFAGTPPRAMKGQDMIEQIEREAEQAAMDGDTTRTRGDKRKKREAAKDGAGE